MCPSRLEIELNDDLLSRIDRASVRTGRSRTTVVVDAVRDHLPAEPSSDASAIEERLTRLKAVMNRAERLGRERSQDDIDAELATIRGDRGHGR